VVIDDVLADPCPTCGVRPSRVAIVGDGKWRARCRCGTRVKQIVGSSSDVGEPERKLRAEEEATRDFIRALLDKSEPAALSFVEVYLAGRGITVTPDVLRFTPRLKHSPSGLWLPAMLAPVVDVNGNLVGLHRTFLDPDGRGKAGVSPAKMMLGRCAGGAVRLAEPADGKVAISEGIESGLSVMQETGEPVWAALSAPGVAALVLPPSVSHVTIYADNDPAGIAAARKVGARWCTEQKRVELVRPRESSLDFNDVILASKT
jgi:hypothetical protein